MRNDAEKTAANRSALAQISRRSRTEERAGASLSGNERDHLFLSARGAQFADVAGVAGLDDPADGRAFGILDYDRDGWLDIALVNSNAPMLELYRNQIGCHPAASGARRGRMVALRFVGGNAAAEPTRSWSARDGFGARVTVDLGDRTILREHRAGEGFATQNSATMVVGIGDHDTAASVNVRWPAGGRQVAAEVPAGTLLTVYENPAQSPTGEAFVREPYVRPLSAPRREVATSPVLSPRLVLPDGTAAGAAPLRVYTTMATWCTACKEELPQFRRLRAAFKPQELAIAGVPIDQAETARQIEAWGAAHKPAYGLLTGLSVAQVASVKNVVLERLNFDAVPAAIVTDRDGNVLLARWGPPTLSQLRELLAKVRGDARTKGTPRRCQE